MSKTPEELAEEHANWRCPEQGHEFIVWCMCKDDFLAGYKAAQEHAHAALEEAEARIQELRDQLADADKVMPDTCEHILDMSKMVDVNGWISVKDRLPKDGSGLLIVYNYYLNEVATAYYDGDMWCTTGGEYISHWQPLPEPPKGEE